MKIICNWGNFPVSRGDEVYFRTLNQVTHLFQNVSEVTPRGLGRCYGDSSLGEVMLNTTHYNRIVSFDCDSGQLVCESGVSLDQVLDHIVPKGWFLPVTPGTKFVTLGGAVASDVHGKNHHVSGSISRHILFLEVQTNKGIVKCSKSHNADLFNATCGGMGLTGLIVTVGIQLIPIRSAYIRQKNIIARNLDEVMAYFDQYHHWTYSVAWIDCLQQGDAIGRSVLMLGEHAEEASLPLTLPKKRVKKVPFYFPAWGLNKWTVKLFNQFYFYWQCIRKKSFISDYETFFYPLDSIHCWNRLYGKRGFMQYQCVIPLLESRQGLYKILSRISKEGSGSFLAVLKKFGEQESLISFPMEGYTLALDFPVTQKTLALLDELDKIVLSHKGRVYMAKDARMSSEMFHQSYSNSQLFIQKKRKWDPHNMFLSYQSKRLGIQ